MGTFDMVFDSVDKRPACVLLQAAYGCPSDLVHLFDTKLWHLAPRKTFVKVPCTREQVERHAERLNREAR